MGTQQEIGGAEKGQHAVLNLAANLWGGIKKWRFYGAILLLLFYYLFGRPEGVFRRDVLYVVGQRVVGQNGLLLVDFVDGIFERELGRRVLLIV